MLILIGIVFLVSLCFVGCDDDTVPSFTFDESIDLGNYIVEKEENDLSIDSGYSDLTFTSPLLATLTFSQDGQDIGCLSWEDGVFKFEGKAEESAVIFFECFLKSLIDDYINSKLNKD